MTTPPSATTQPTTAWAWLKAPADAAGSGPGLRWHPSRLAECLAARADALPAPLAPGELDELRRAHETWGADAASRAAIARLGQPACRVVVTGQQPGLLAGPLLVVYKALGAVKLARRLAEQHPDTPCVPVFWVASEDHDFAEVREAVWPGQGGALESGSLPEPPSAAAAMVGPLPTAEAIDALAGQIKQTCLPTAFRDDVLAAVREAYAGTLEDGFCRLLLRLLAGTGLVIVSPLMGWVRRRAAAVLAGELARPGQSTAAVNAAGDRLDRGGWGRALKRPDASLNVFWIDDAGRRVTLRLDTDGRVRRRLAGADADLDVVRLDELKAELQAHPERFSTNVVSRPLVQDAVLPTVAQLVGPGEAAYLAQVEPVYDTFDVFAPVRWPRPEVLLLEPRVERHLAKHGLDLSAALASDAEALAEMVLRAAAADGPLERVERLQARQLGELLQLKEQLGAEPALASAIDKLTGAVEKGFDKLGERIVQQQRRTQTELAGAMGTVAASVRPRSQPQERVLNPIAPFAINYGLDWPARLAPLLHVAPDQKLHVVPLANLREA